MTIEHPPAPPPVAAQAVTVVQPAAKMTLDVGFVAEWAIAIAAIAAIIALVYKLMTRELSRDIGDIRHDIDDTTGRVDKLERARTDDIARIVKVETTLTGLERGQDRIERAINDRFDQLAVSIREIRNVTPR